MASHNTAAIYLIRPCAFMICEPSIRGIGLGGLVSTPSLLIPAIRPIPYTDGGYGDFCRLWSSMGSSVPLSAPKLFARPIWTDDNAAGSLVEIPELRRGRWRFSWLGVQAPRHFLSAHHWRHNSSFYRAYLLTRYLAVAATGVPRATADCAFGRRETVAVPPRSAPNHSGAPAPADEGPPSPSA